MRSSPLIPGGSFRVDLEQAPKAIEDRQSALDELQEISRMASALGRVDPTSNDSVSIDAATAFGRVADGGPGSLGAAVDEGIRQLHELIQSLRNDLADYGKNQSAIAESFSGDRRM